MHIPRGKNTHSPHSGTLELKSMQVEILEKKNGNQECFLNNRKSIWTCENVVPRVEEYE
jgi:hypothetical protein